MTDDYGAGAVLLLPDLHMIDPALLAIVRAHAPSAFPQHDHADQPKGQHEQRP